MVSNARLALGLFMVRLIDALTVSTFFQPDEYFQSLEPAWQAAFGVSSGAWITWEWREHLRSSIHPLLFAGVYKVATHIAHLLNANPSTRSLILIAAPKILQAGFAALGDLFTYRMACKIYGSQHSASLAALALTVFSPWQWFCSTRTLSNSAETTLTIIALDLWPWDYFVGRDRDASSIDGRVRTQVSSGATSEANPGQSQLRAPQSKRIEAVKSTFYVSLTCAAIACVLRPTNIMVWATISITLLLRSGDTRKLMYLMKSAALCGSAVLAIAISVDRAFYGELVFPPLRFLYFNIVQSLAVFYGNNRPDYYLTEGFPLLLTTAVPFAIMGIGKVLLAGDVSDRESRTLFVLALACITSITVLSLISHKEVRFIYPLLPMLHILAAKPVAVFFNPFPWPAKRYRSALLCLGLLVNLLIAGYTGYVHQRGVLDVIDYVRSDYESNLSKALSSHDGVLSEYDLTVGFFMPCHSTPWRSHLVHPGIKAWALTCEPPLNLTLAEREDYLDEADVFYDDPAGWIKNNLKGVDTITVDITSQRIDTDQRRSWPQYLVFFEQLEPVLNKALRRSKYQECWRGFNTHWHDDWRRQGDVVVWCIDTEQNRKRDVFSQQSIAA